MQIYEAGAANFTHAYPGVPATLRELRRRGLRLGVVTNKPHTPTLAILDSLGFRGHFDAVVGGDSLPQRKPHPGPILAALATLGVPPDAAVMVDDNYHDVEAAHAAGLRAWP